MNLFLYSTLNETSWLPTNKPWLHRHPYPTQFFEVSENDKSGNDLKQINKWNEMKSGNIT